jgi:transposase
MRGEVMRGPERRRRWSASEKLRIVRASLEPGAVVSAIARQFDVSRQQVYGWRRAARKGALEDGAVGFVEVTPLLAAPTARPEIAEAMASSSVEPVMPAAPPPPPLPASVTVEVGLAGGRSLRAPAGLSSEELVRLIRAVERA